MDTESAATNTKSDRETNAQGKVFRILVIGEVGSGEKFSFLQFNFYII